MQLPSRPSLKRLSAERLAYRVSALFRLGLGLLALGLTALGRFSPPAEGFSHLLWYALAIVTAGAALSGDDWTFLVSGEIALRRRFGLFPLTKTWTLERGRISSICLVSGRAGELPHGQATDREKMEASILGMGRHDWVALTLVLDDGRSLAMDSGRPSRYADFLRDGDALASALGLPFVDSTTACCS
jgi:hypothetical protein